MTNRFNVIAEGKYALKPSTAGFTTTLLGLIALALHGALTFMTLLGTASPAPPTHRFPTGRIILHAAVPAASVAVALYGVWNFRARHP